MDYKREIKKELPERLSEFRAALEAEIKAIEATGTDSILLTSGKRVSGAMGEFWYAFDIDYMPVTPPGSPCRMKVDGNSYDVTIVSVDENQIVLSCAKPIDAVLSSAKLDTGSTVLMASLIKRIEDTADNNNPFGEALLSDPRKIRTIATDHVPSGTTLDDLNEQQKRAVTSSLQYNLTYLWGPPGTGKTTVISKSIEAAFSRGDSILLASHTNTAVDNALESILDKDLFKNTAKEISPILRLGQCGALGDKHPEITEKAHLEYLSKDLTEQIDTLEKEKLALQVSLNEKEQTILEYKWAKDPNLADVELNEKQVNDYLAKTDDKSEYISSLQDNISKLESAYPEIGDLERAMAEYDRKNDLLKRLAKHKDEYQENLISKEQYLKEAQQGLHAQEQYRKLIGDLVKHEELEKLLVARNQIIQQLSVIDKNISSIDDLITKEQDKYLSIENMGRIGKLFSRQSSQELFISINVNTSKKETLNKEKARLLQTCKEYDDEIDIVKQLQHEIDNLIITKDYNYWLTEVTKAQKEYDNAKMVASEGERLYNETLSEIGSLKRKVEDDERLIWRYKKMLDELENQQQELRNLERKTKIAKSKLTRSQNQAVKQYNDLFAAGETAFSEVITAAAETIRARYSDADIESLTQELDAINAEITGIVDKLNELERQRESLKTEIIRQAKIIGTTLTKAYIDDAMQSRSFDTVIIDEVSMASIPALWCVALVATKHLIVVGDFLQLPPIVISDNALAKKWLGTDVFYISKAEECFKKSAFTPENCIALSEQYRMEAAIANIANRYYGNYTELISNDDNARRVAARDEFFSWYPYPADKKPVHIIDTNELHAWATSVPRGKKSSRMNYFSASFVVSFAFQLIEKAITDNPEADQDIKPKVLIVSPYKAHTDRVNKLIKLESSNRDLPAAADYIKAGTVHSFQGKEADIVLFDCVVDEPHWKAKLFMGGSNTDRDIEIEKSNRQLFNVAATRAKFRLFIIGNIPFLRSRAKNNALGSLLTYLLDTRKIKPESTSKYIPKLVYIPENYFTQDRLSAKRLVCTQSAFYSFFNKDLTDVHDYIMIYSPFLSTNRISKVLPYLADIKNNGADVIVVTKALEKRMSKKDIRNYIKCKKALTDIGITVIHRKGAHEKFTFIDDHILWSGSLNILSNNDSTGECMERIDDEEYVNGYKQLFGADQYLQFTRDAQERRCPLCNGEMIACESSSGIYWRCANNDFTYNKEQTFPYGGVLRCNKCGADYSFGMKKQPRWICTADTNHYQVVKPYDLSLPKMKQLIPPKDLPDVTKYLNISTSKTKKASGLLPQDEIDKYTQEALLETNGGEQISIHLPTHKKKTTIKKAPAKPTQIAIDLPSDSLINNDNPDDTLDSLVNTENDQYIQDLFSDEKFGIFRSYCDLNGYETITDIEDFVFSDLLVIPGITTDIANAILTIIEAYN